MIPAWGQFIWEGEEKMAVRDPINAKGNVVSDNRVEAFRTGFQGEVIRPADPAYDKARRIWNATIDKHPGIIARCAGVADVVDAVNFARQNELLVAVRGAATMSAAGPSATTGWPSTCLA